MNEEQEEYQEQQPSKKEIEKAKAAQAGKDIVDTAGRAAATYAGGAAGAKIYDVVAKSKLGQKTLNEIGNRASSNPLARKALAKSQEGVSAAKPLVDSALGSSNGDASGFSNKSAVNSSSPVEGGNNSLFNKPNSTNTTGSEQTGDNQNSDISAVSELLPKMSKGNAKTTLTISIIFSVFIILIVIIAFCLEKVAPWYGLAQFAATTGEKFLNFFSGCGWSTDEECDAKLQNNFYSYVDQKYKEYNTKYDVELDKNLIIATLTYTDPYLTTSPGTDEEGQEVSSGKIDYKKSKRQVDLLIENMIRKTDENCYLKDKNGNLETISCASKDKYDSSVPDENGKTLYIEPSYVLDTEKYRNYLENTFVYKYYLNNKKTEDTKSQMLKIVDEIYDMDELFDEMDEDQNGYNNITYQPKDSYITVTDCQGIMFDKVTLSEYLQGVVYANMDDNSSEEYLNFVAMSAKNYLYYVNGASTTTAVQSFTIKSCKTEQLYCNTSKGCHYVDDTDTLMNGSDGSYYKEPIRDTGTIEKIKKAINETKNDFLVSDNSIVKTKYNGENKSDIISKLNNKTYKEVMVEIYGGEVKKLELSVTGYPLDLNYTEVTSGYGWRQHPKKEDECRHHNGTDIAASLGSNIYSIADGVVIDVKYNPDVINGLGHYIIIGHGNVTNNGYEYYSLYAHMNTPPIVSVGSKVSAGQLIGYVGSTGASTGPHLHIEIYSYVNGVQHRQDPVKYFKNIQLIGVVGPEYSSQAQCLSNK